MFDRMAYLRMWQACQIRPEHLAEVKHYASLIFNYKSDFYDPVEAAMGIPWYLVGCLDMREESFDHHCYLGNGDPLAFPTRHVPHGRGPFQTWYQGAIDALTLDHMSILKPGQHWDIVTVLIKCEGYNGLGYAAKNLPSPYVWSLTNQQKPGKYIADGHFDPSVWDTQSGCAAVLLALRQFHQVDLREA